MSWDLNIVAYSPDGVLCLLSLCVLLWSSMFALCCLFATSKAAIHEAANKLGMIVPLVAGGHLTVALPMSPGLVAELTPFLWSFYFHANARTNYWYKTDTLLALFRIDQFYLFSNSTNSFCVFVLLNKKICSTVGGSLLRSRLLNTIWYNM